MKKVLIISYFFPPANFVGAERTAAWAKYLYEFGYYPIIITRNWNENQTDLTDRVINNDYSIEKTDQYEIRRLPYKHSLRDKLAEAKRFRLLQKGLTLKELILSNFFISSLPYANFYDEAKSVLKKENDIVAVIASGRPFQSFAIVHQLKKEFSKIKWIPDYRDEWTTHSRKEHNSLLQNLINKIEEKSEPKWASNADLFLTVSNVVKDNLENSLKTNGRVILNGFDHSSIDFNYHPIKNEINIMYAGTIYLDQDFSIIINAIEALKNEFKIILHFIGVGLNQNLIESLIIENNIEIKLIPRLSKVELYEYLTIADLLLLTSYSKTIGSYPVKIFEYYNSKIPIILTPSDRRVMEDFILKTNSGFIANTEEECKEVLLRLIEQKKEGKSIQLERNTEYGEQFSRKNQTKRLAEILDTL